MSNTTLATKLVNHPNFTTELFIYNEDNIDLDSLTKEQLINYISEYDTETLELTLAEIE